jgi:arylsulfatase A-like enzyme
VLSYASAKPRKHLTYEKGPGKYELYNLADDPAEQNNLAESHPERLKQMLAALEKINSDGHTRPGFGQP